jgi:hypothetical protein
MSLRPAEITGAIEAYLASLDRLGIPAPSLPASTEDLEAVAREIAPMRLPAQVVTLWSRFQLDCGRAVVGRSLLDTKSAIEAWRYGAETRVYPACLFPIAYEDHGLRWIELDGEADRDGGLIWEAEDDAAEISLAAPTLADGLIATAAAWDSGLLEYEPNQGFSRFRDYDGWRRLCRQRFGAPRVVPVWARHDWLPRWKLLSGLEEVEPYPSEMVTAIADLRASPTWLRSEPTIIEGQVTWDLMSGSVRATIQDGTGRLEVWVPQEVDLFGDAFTGGHLQLTVLPSGGQAQSERLRADHEAVADALEDGRMPDAVEIGIKLAALLSPAGAEAVATEVRRVVS